MFRRNKATFPPSIASQMAVDDLGVAFAEAGGEVAGDVGEKLGVDDGLGFHEEIEAVGTEGEGLDVGIGTDGGGAGRTIEQQIGRASCRERV